MPRFTKHFTGRTFPNLFPPLTLAEVKERAGERWRALTPRLLKIVELLEDWNPTDEETGEYKEFHLSNQNPDLCRMLRTDDYKKLKYIAIRIGLLKETNSNFSIGYYSKAFIYNPRVGEILEDLRHEALTTPPAWELKWKGTWEQRQRNMHGPRWMVTGRTLEAPQLPLDKRGMRTRIKRGRSTAGELLSMAKALEDYTGGTLEAGAEFYIKKHDWPLLPLALAVGVLFSTCNEKKQHWGRFALNPAAVEMLGELAKVEAQEREQARAREERRKRRKRRKDKELQRRARFFGGGVELQ